MFSIYEQVHLYGSICLITGWGSKGAATARLLPYMGGTLTYTKVMDTSICIILFSYSYTHIYFLCIKHTHLHVRQSEEMIPAVVGPPRSEVS